VETLTAEEASYRSLQEYTNYVTKSRVLPSICLKPVHRRILWCLIKDGARSRTGKFIKTSSIAGSTLRFHPHGTASVEGAISTLVSSSNNLVLGRGNWSSYLGTPPAASRYTEIKTSELFEEIYDNSLLDIGDFVPSYDETDKEPVIIPTKVPLPLLIGLDAIGVGMAAKHFPVTIQDVIDDLYYLMTKQAERVNYTPALGCIRVGNSVYPEHKIVKKDGKEYLNITKLPIGSDIGIIQSNPYIHELVCSKQIEVIDKTSKDGLNILIHAPQALQQLVLSSTAKGLGMDLKYYWKRLRTSGFLEEWLAYRMQYVTKREYYDTAQEWSRNFVLVALNELNQLDFNKNNFQSVVSGLCENIYSNTPIPEEYNGFIPTLKELTETVKSKPLSAVRAYGDIGFNTLYKFTQDHIKQEIVGELEHIDKKLFSPASKPGELKFSKFDKKIRKYIYYRPGAVIEVKASRIPRVLNYEVDSDSVVLFNSDGTTVNMQETFFGRLELGKENKFVGFGSRGETTVLVTESKKIVALTRTSVLKEPIVAAFPCKKIQVDGKDYVVRSGLSLSYQDGYKVLEA
jgi:hypothetical protein